MKTDSEAEKPGALRKPRQSVQEELDRRLREDANTFAGIALFTIGLAAYLGFCWWRNIPPQPLVASIIAFLIFAYCIVRIFNLRRRAHRLKPRRDDEIAVREYLKQLRENGCAVFHDVAGENFSIEHVVLSEKGIFSLETKSLRKPYEKAQIHCDPAKVMADGVGDQSAIVERVAEKSRALKALLRKSSGRDFEVKPVVVFPHWFVLHGLQERYWVISPRALPSLMEKQPSVFKPEEVHLAAYHLSRCIRASV